MSRAHSLGHWSKLLFRKTVGANIWLRAIKHICLKLHICVTLLYTLERPNWRNREVLMGFGKNFGFVLCLMNQHTTMLVCSCAGSVAASGLSHEPVTALQIMGSSITIVTTHQVATAHVKVTRLWP